MKQEHLGTICLTKKGHWVQSKGEKKIADFLFDQKIEYVYEPTLKIGSEYLHPDFYLPKYDVYIEFFGLLGKKRYDWFIFHKKDIYEKSGKRVIELYPNNLYKLGSILKQRFEKLTHVHFPQAAYFPY